MNTPDSIHHHPALTRKALLTACAIALGGVAPSGFAATDLSGIPLYALEGVPPNIALTIDDSGSMAWGYVPDSKSVSNGSNPGKRWFSSSYNAMYYNPRNLYPAPPDENGNPRSTSWPYAYRNGFDTSRGTQDLRASVYRATISYNPNNTSDSSRTDDIGYHYALLDLSNAGCSTSSRDVYGAYTDSDCYDAVAVGTAADIANFDIDQDGDVDAADKQQNFANWYSFYRTRNLATVSAASLAFTQLNPNFRVAFQNLHTCDGFDTSCKDRIGTTYDSRVTVFDSTARTDFFKWLQRSPANGSTPLLAAASRAGEMFKTSRPYDKIPGSVTSPQYECRGNFSILMTDGIWNSYYAWGVNDYDDASHGLPDGQTYSPTSPYRKDNSDTNLADIALKYWAEDLSSLPSSDVLRFMPVESNETFGGKTFTPYWNPKNDPATWQHMVTYTIGLGLGGYLGSDWDGDMYSGAFPSLADGSKNWPNTQLDAVPGNVYDLWHAAVNGRGRFYSAESPDDVVKAFEEIIKGISDRQGTAVAASLSGSRIATDTYVYQTSFNTSDWSGNLYAYGISDGTGSGGSCNTEPRGSVCSGATWQAASQLDAKDWSSGRNIITNSGGGKPFRWTSLSSSHQTLLDNGDSLGDKRLDFIRGDRSLEGTTFRKRSSVLGDIINSAPAPLYVGAPEFYYPGDADYSNFQTAYAGRRKMVYVGANDGMLHAFDAMTGEEVFAFIPSAVYPNLHKLARKDYDHASFVDGGMIAYDIKASGAFKTYLFGGLGLGGKAVYALDITDPATFSESNAGNIFKWEFTDANLGYTYGKPRVVTLRTGETAVIFGSGYTDGTTAAALYVVNAANGNLIARLAVPTSDGGGTTFSNNGISGITAVDLHGATPTEPQDGYVDAVYAGDLYGNLWKFDFTTATPAVAYSGKPMYVARDPYGNRQPITTEPATGRHPTGNGVIVYFGTGKYLGASDTTTSQIQTFYGIWNKQDAHNTGITRTHLLKQTIVRDDSGTFTNTDARVTSNNTVYWHDTDDGSLPTSGSHLGWYLDLSTESRERVHQAPFLRGDRVIFVTVTPSDNPCNAGGSSWVYELQAFSGSRLKNVTPFDYNQDGAFNNSDFVDDGSGNKIPASGIRFDNAGVYFLDKESIITDCRDGGDCKMVSTSSVGVLSVGESDSTRLRRTWRELVAE
ncbi:MAG: PilC/PilY family type IV pilus protein [Pseudomonadota bacterium]